MPTMTLERLAQAEEELAAACELLRTRVREASDTLEALQAAHIDAAARLRLTGGAARRLAAAWTRAWGALRVQVASWGSDQGALGWLRDRELALARRYAAVAAALDDGAPLASLLRDALLPGAWARYMRAERLLCQHEWGEELQA